MSIKQYVKRCHKRYRPVNDIEDIMIDTLHNISIKSSYNFLNFALFASINNDYDTLASISVDISNQVIDDRSMQEDDYIYNNIICKSDRNYYRKSIRRVGSQYLTTLRDKARSKARR